MTTDTPLSKETAPWQMALPAEMARVRDELMPMYQSIGPAGMFALSMMRADLDYAARVMAASDVVGMIQAYQKLKEYKA